MKDERYFMKQHLSKNGWWEKDIELVTRDIIMEKVETPQVSTALQKSFLLNDSCLQDFFIRLSLFLDWSNVFHYLGGSPCGYIKMMWVSEGCQTIQPITPRSWMHIRPDGNY